MLRKIVEKLFWHYQEKDNWQMKMNEPIKIKKLTKEEAEKALRGGGRMDKFEIVIDLDGRRYVEDDVYEDEDFCRNSAQKLKNRFTDFMRVYIKKNGTIVEEMEESSLRWLIDNYAN